MLPAKAGMEQAFDKPERSYEGDHPQYKRYGNSEHNSSYLMANFSWRILCSNSLLCG